MIDERLHGDEWWCGMNGLMNADVSSRSYSVQEFCFNLRLMPEFKKFVVCRVELKVFVEAGKTSYVPKAMGVFLEKRGSKVSTIDSPVDGLMAAYMIRRAGLDVSIADGLEAEHLDWVTRLVAGDVEEGRKLHELDVASVKSAFDLAMGSGDFSSVELAGTSGPGLSTVS